MVENKKIENSITIATDDKSTDVLYSVNDGVMTIHSFTARFTPDNFEVLKKAVLFIEEKARNEFLDGINVELQVKEDEREAASRFLMERGYFIPDVDSYVIEVDVDSISKAHVLGMKDSRASIDPAKRMKKTSSMVKEMPPIDGEIVEELSYTLVSEKNPQKAGISILSTQTDETLVAEYIMVEDDNIKELIPYMQVILPGIAAMNKYKKFQVMASSYILANLFKKMLAGVDITEKIVMGSYKLL